MMMMVIYIPIVKNPRESWIKAVRLLLGLFSVFRQAAGKRPDHRLGSLLFWSESA